MPGNPGINSRIEGRIFHLFSASTVDKLPSERDLRFERSEVRRGIQRSLQRGDRTIASQDETRTTTVNRSVEILTSDPGGNMYSKETREEINRLRDKIIQEYFPHFDESTDRYRKNVRYTARRLAKLSMGLKGY
jgi:hypothetical protein